LRRFNQGIGHLLAQNVQNGAERVFAVREMRRYGKWHVLFVVKNRVLKAFSRGWDFVG